MSITINNFYTHFLPWCWTKGLIHYTSEHTTISNHTATNYNSHGKIFSHTSTHSFYLQVILLHMLQGPKHSQSPPLPVAFLLILHQFCGIVWYETTATCATVRMSVSNKCRDFIASGKSCYVTQIFELLSNIHIVVLMVCPQWYI